jgi:hypothetical protein
VSRRIERHRSGRADHGERAFAAADQSAYQLLFPQRIADDQRHRPARLWRGDLGAVLHLSGWNEKTGWMHTSSGVDNVDEFAETVEMRGACPSTNMVRHGGR